MALADRFDGLLIDFDGVVWIGEQPVPGSPETLTALLEAGKQLAFVTNNPSKHPAAYAERLAGMGVEVGPERIVTAGVAVARLAAEAAARAGGNNTFVVGSTTLRETIAAAGLNVVEGEAGREADVVVVSGYRGFDYEMLLTAKLALDRGAAFIGSSHDATMPMPGGDWPGSGAILAAVETASGRQAEIGGKPERHLFELALDAIRGSKDTNAEQKEPRDGRVAMVGDRVASDIAGGHAAGLETVLVLSGADGRAEAEAATPPPDHVIENLAGLLR